MDDDSIISFLRSRGPSLPSDISKHARTNTVFVGAHLSAMVEKKIVFVSNIRIGSSPLYYLKEHKSKLEQFIKHMDEKDRRTFELLKQKKVLRDKDQNPLIRVSLRAIKDFAVQLNVRISDSSEIFWKLYSITDEEASSIIKGILEPPAIETPVKELTKPSVEESKSEVKKEDIKLEEGIEKEKPAKDLISAEQKKPLQEKEKIKQKRQVQEKLVQENIKESPATPKLTQKIPAGEFYTLIEQDFSKKSITIISSEIIKNNKEYDLIIKLPSTSTASTPRLAASRSRKSRF